MDLYGSLGLPLNVSEITIPAEDLLGCIHYNPDIIDADRPLMSLEYFSGMSAT